MKKLKNNKTLIVLITIMIISSIWLLTPGMPYGHDIHFHHTRLVGLANSIKTGDFIALIHNSFYGYGYATGLFYSNFYFYIPSILNILGLSSITSLKLLYFSVNILTTLSIFWCLKSITNDKKISVIGTILYMFSNYRLVDIYPRGAMGEILAFMIIPIVILGLYEIVYRDYKKWYLFTIGFVLLLLCHLITTFLLSIFVFIFLLLNIKRLLNDKNRLKYLIVSGIIGLLLGLFFLAPILEQKLYGNINIFEGTSYYLPQDNIVSIKDFLIPANFFNKYLGLSLVLLLPIRFFIKKNEENKKNIACADTFFILGIIAWLFTTSLFPWKLVGNSVNFIQFPWRLLIIATTFLVIAYTIYFRYINKTSIKKYAYFIVLIISCLEILIYSIEYGIGKVQYKEFTENEIGTREYLLYGTNVEDFDKKTPMITSNNPNIKLDYSKNGTSMKIEYSNNYEKDTYIELPLFNYLGYEAKGAKLENGNNNLIRLLLDKEEGKIEVKYKGTKVQKISYVISSVTLSGLIIYIIIEKRRKEWS